MVRQWVEEWVAMSGLMEEHHRHSACPYSHHLLPLLLKATQTRAVCKNAVVGWIHPESPTQATASTASPGAVPCTDAPAGLLASWYERMNMVMLNTWPTCCWNVILPMSGIRCASRRLNYEGDTFLCMLWCLQWGQSPTATMPHSCICRSSHSSSSAWPLALLVQPSVEMQQGYVLLGLLPLQLSFCILWPLSHYSKMILWQGIQLEIN